MLLTQRVFKVVLKLKKKTLLNLRINFFSTILSSFSNTLFLINFDFFRHDHNFLKS